MNIALLFYGQPRNYMDGYHNIMKLLSFQDNITVDFFYHCWTNNNGCKYNTSPYHETDEKFLLYNDNIKEYLKELYSPISYEYENQIEHFDETIYINTFVYKNITSQNTTMKNNINNILSQAYSRNKVRNLLDKYIQNNKKSYDFVIMTRFDIDIGTVPIFNFKNLDSSKTYVSDMHCPRKIIPDNFILTSTETFLKWFNIYEELDCLLDNHELLEKIIQLNEYITINIEELILASYIFHFDNLDNIKYFRYYSCIKKFIQQVKKK